VPAGVKGADGAVYIAPDRAAAVQLAAGKAPPGARVFACDAGVGDKRYGAIVQADSPPTARSYVEALLKDEGLGKVNDFTWVEHERRTNPSAPPRSRR
jgi:hypothetical protein